MYCAAFKGDLLLCKIHFYKVLEQPGYDGKNPLTHFKKIILLVS